MKFSKPILIFLSVLLGLLVIGGTGLLLMKQWITLGAYVGMLVLIALGGTIGWRQETDQDHR